MILSRREILAQTGLGIGWLAAQHMMHQEGLAAVGGNDLRQRDGDFAPRAKSIILLTMVGGPSQMDLFDPKEDLARLHGQKHEGELEFLQPGSQDKKLMTSEFPFSKHGECGMDFSSMLPDLASIADELCMVRSMYSANNNHPQAQRFFHSGKTLSGWPTFGSWICYALGTENQNMPGFVVLRDSQGYADGGTNHWTSGWLPAVFGGTEIRSQGEAVLNLRPAQKNPPGVRRRNLSLLAQLNEYRRQLYPDDTRLDSRIKNYELAARMQVSAEELLDLSRETAATKAMYGIEDPTTEDFGTRCLMARRMVEAGVRFVEVMTPVKHGPSPFDSHTELKEGLTKICPMVDRPSMALIRDLKQRGLLDSTIVIWSGEFGRLPVSQHGNGRDHNRNAFTLLAAGGGFKLGHIHGATDSIGYRAVEDPVSVHDLHATLLHQLGVDHTTLQYPHDGRQ